MDDMIINRRNPVFVVCVCVLLFHLFFRLELQKEILEITKSSPAKIVAMERI